MAENKTKTEGVTTNFWTLEQHASHKFEIKFWELKSRIQNKSVAVSYVLPLTITGDQPQQLTTTTMTNNNNN